MFRYARIFVGMSGSGTQYAAAVMANMERYWLWSEDDSQWRFFRLKPDWLGRKKDEGCMYMQWKTLVLRGGPCDPEVEEVPL